MSQHCILAQSSGIGLSELRYIHGVIARCDTLYDAHAELTVFSRGCASQIEALRADLIMDSELLDSQASLLTDVRISLSDCSVSLEFCRKKSALYKRAVLFGVPVAVGAGVLLGVLLVR